MKDDDTAHDATIAVAPTTSKVARETSPLASPAPEPLPVQQFTIVEAPATATVSPESVLEVSEAVRMWDVAALVVARMILISTATFAATAFMADTAFPGPDEKLIRLTLLILCITPTANTVVVAAAMRQTSSGHAETLARVLAFEYLVFIATLTAFASIALSLLY